MVGPSAGEFLPQTDQPLPRYTTSEYIEESEPFPIKVSVSEKAYGIGEFNKR